MKNSELLKKFKDKHKELCNLNPEISIDEITEIYYSDREPVFYDPPLLQICIKHEFIFDKRLIPKTFENIEVINVTMEGSPTLFIDENDDREMIPLFEHGDPKKYKLYVDNNIDLIRLKLKSPKMSKREALDALTGNFIEYKAEIKKLKKDFLFKFKKHNGEWQEKKLLP